MKIKIISEDHTKACDWIKEYNVPVKEYNLNGIFIGIIAIMIIIIMYMVIIINHHDRLLHELYVNKLNLEMPNIWRMK